MSSPALRREEIFSALISKSSWLGSSVDSKVFAPGRIEILGKHTDYAGGDSVTCAVHLGVYVIARFSDSRALRIYSETFDESVVFDLEGNRTEGSSHWMIYPEVVVKRIVSDFGGIDRGLDIHFSADLPHAAGMSSSSALITALFLTLDDLLKFSSTDLYKVNIPDRLHLGEYLGAVENGLNYANFPKRKGVGTFGGSEDHVAVLCSKEGQLGHYSYLPTISRNYAPLSSDHIFVLAHSGVFAEKSGNALKLYNKASSLAGEVRELIVGSDDQLSSHTLGELLRMNRASLENVFEIIRSERKLKDANALCDRYSQFYMENVEIIPAFMTALQNQDYGELGRQVDRSQLFTTTLLKNQVSETVYLAQKARQLGSIASSAFGGGFGGSVWSLVESDQAHEFLRQWEEAYSEQYPDLKTKAKFFIANAEAGAQVVD